MLMPTRMLQQKYGQTPTLLSSKFNEHLSYCSTQYSKRAFQFLFLNREKPTVVCGGISKTTIHASKTEDYLNAK